MSVKNDPAFRKLVAAFDKGKINDTDFNNRLADLRQRNADAQARIEQRKKRVSIPYNRGGYMLIEGQDPTTFGRK